MSDAFLPPTSPQQPEAIEPTGSPLVPSALVDLYLRPTRFFSRHLALGSTPYLLLVSLVYGVSYSIGRVDKQMVRADLGRPQRVFDSVGLVDHWFLFWGFVLIAGSVSAVFIWGIGGWWYNLRVRWSGALDADPFVSRLVYVYSSFVFALPAVLLTSVATALYPNYRAFWLADEVWSSSWLVFVFWSCVTSYRGVRATFPVSPWKARVWFLVLPVLVYVVAYVAIGMAYVARGLG